MEREGERTDACDGESTYDIAGGGRLSLSLTFGAVYCLVFEFRD